MAEFLPPSVTLPDTTSDDPRIGQLLSRRVDDLAKARAVIIGFPTDEGVRRNGGRPGAALAPDFIRNALYRMTPDPRRHHGFVELLERTVDLGDLVLAGSLEEDQEQLGEVLAPLLRQGTVPIVLGGGHETAFGHFLGYVYAGRSVSILNWDAHPDVRPLREGRGHSGSPFRQAILHLSGTCQGYTVAGLLPHGTAQAHLDFLNEHAAEHVWHDAVTPERVDDLYARMTGTHMVSFDLDAVDQSQAPGVSAPAVGGLAVGLWLQAAFEAGRCGAVASIDVSELNPTVDLDQQTARLAALTVWHFLRGLAMR